MGNFSDARLFRLVPQHCKQQIGSRLQMKTPDISLGHLVVLTDSAMIHAMRLSNANTYPCVIGDCRICGVARNAGELGTLFATRATND
jgi:hypothetical protein